MVEETIEKQAQPEQSQEQLMAQLQEALKSGDFKLVAKVSGQLVKFQKEREQAELESKQAALMEVTQKVRASIEKLLDGMIDKGLLDLADGVWMNWDFGAQREVGVNPAVRLVKVASTRKPRTGGGGGGAAKYPRTEDLMPKYSSQMYKDSGMTFQQAWESNTDKNWRYGIREAILKGEGLI